MKAKSIVLGCAGALALAGIVVGANAARDQMYDGQWVASVGQRARAASGQTTFTEIVVNNPAGVPVAAFGSDIIGDGIGGIANHNGNDRAIMDISASDGGRFYVFSSANVPTFVMDGNRGVGAASGDVAEMFPSQEALEPGSVVVIDAQNHGAMRLATSAYDRRVAGVVAGANDYRSAITLRALDGALGKVPVTLTGTAYCLATNSNGPIKAGDLLTTSSVPGHAMRVTDYAAAHGAILGKALEDLKGDSGHILMLASLQ